MSAATCGTCPLWTRARDRYDAAKPGLSGFCHLSVPLSLNDDGFKPNEDWFCSEHPLLQRDRLAAMAMPGIMAGLPVDYERATLPYAETARAFASQAYEIADAMLAARGETSHG